MQIRIEQILKVLLVLFLFLNVTLINVEIFGINIRYLVFISACFIAILVHSKGKHVDKKIMRSLALISLFAILLFFYSVLFRGNKIENALWFIKPYFTLLSIPLFSILFRYYSVRKIIDYFIYTTLILSVYYILLIALLYYSPGIAFKVIDLHGLTSLTVINELPRLFLKTSVFFIPVFAYSLLYSKTTFQRLLYSLLVLLQITCFLTFGYFFGVIIVLILYFAYKGYTYNVIIVSLIILFCITTILIDLESYFSPSKLYSINTKISQLINGFTHDNVISFLFGDGIGAPIIGLDERNLKNDFVIEVSPVLIYKVGGVFGSLMIIFIYSSHAIIGYLKSLNSKNKEIAFLAISQIGMLFASVSNPYIWNGGTGILFVSMLIAALNKKT